MLRILHGYGSSSTKVKKLVRFSSGVSVADNINNANGTRFAPHTSHLFLGSHILTGYWSMAGSLNKTDKEKAHTTSLCVLSNFIFTSHFSGANKSIPEL